MIRIEPDGPLDEAAVAAFERECGVALPAEYRSWLITVGGGEAAEDYEVENGVVSEFLTLGGTLGYDLASWRGDRTGFFT